MDKRMSVTHTFAIFAEACENNQAMRCVSPFRLKTKLSKKTSKISVLDDWGIAEY